MSLNDKTVEERLGLYRDHLTHKLGLLGYTDSFTEDPDSVSVSELIIASSTSASRDAYRECLNLLELAFPELADDYRPGSESNPSEPE